MKKSLMLCVMSLVILSLTSCSSAQYKSEITDKIEDVIAQNEDKKYIDVHIRKQKITDVDFSEIINEEI